MTAPDIRWKQRFENFKKALAQLNEIVEHIHARYVELFRQLSATFDGHLTDE